MKPKVTLARVIRAAIDQAMKECHVGMPAKVTAFNANKRTCNVQPLLTRVSVDESGANGAEEKEESYPQICNVPVMYPGGNGIHMRWPLKVGDVVYLSFADRAIETWKSASEGTEVDPTENRAHDLKDAVAFAVLRPPSSAHPEVRNAFVIGSEDGTVEMEIDTSKITLRAPQLDYSAGGDADTPMVRGQDLVSYLSQVVGMLLSHTHPVTALGESGASVALAALPTPPSSMLSQNARLK